MIQLLILDQLKTAQWQERLTEQEKKTVARLEVLDRIHTAFFLRYPPPCYFRFDDELPASQRLVVVYDPLLVAEHAARFVKAQERSQNKRTMPLPQDMPNAVAENRYRPEKYRQKKGSGR